MGSFVLSGASVNGFIERGPRSIFQEPGREQAGRTAGSSWHQPHGAGRPVGFYAHGLSASTSVGGGRPASLPCDDEAYVSEQMEFLGWTVSALVHGFILAVSAVASFQTVSLSAMPQKEPFRWEVSLMTAPKVESMVAQSVQAQAASEAVGTDLLPTADAQPSQQVSEYSHHREESVLGDAEAVEPVTRPSAPHLPSVSGQAAGSAEQTARTPAIVNPATALLPPPEVESQQESSSLQVDTQLESPTVLQRPPVVTRSLVTQTTVPDYGWLMEELRTKLERVKAYPASAKAARAQGRVVVQVHIQGDGRLLNPEIEESSGYPMLDHAAVEALRAASPLRLEHILGDGSVVMLVPLNYQLE